jgi:hypothetical protein
MESINLLKPYEKEVCNTIYNLLFCDSPQTLKDKNPEGDWAEVVSDFPDTERLKSIIESPHKESRLKMFAHKKLVEAGDPLQTNSVLGVIIEVAQEEGLDTLAVFSDHSIKYINHSEAMAILEPPHQLEPRATKVIKAAHALSKAMPECDEERMPPPPAGNARISILTDGSTRIGDGPMEALAKDRLGSPILLEGAKLLHEIARLVTKDKK